jgi:hypothetical protein
MAEKDTLFVAVVNVRLARREGEQRRSGTTRGTDVLISLRPRLNPAPSVVPRGLANKRGIFSRICTAKKPERSRACSSGEA